MIAWFCRNHVAANLLMWSILVAGAVSLFRRIPVEIFPESEPDMISIMVPYRGATPREVETGVALLVEESLEGLEGIKRLRSESFENRCSVQVEVEESFDPREVLDEVKNRVDAINNLPVEAERPVISLAQRTRSVISVMALGEFDELEMSRIGEQLRDDLLAVDGITQVELRGTREYEISIEVDEETLQSFSLTLSDVADAVRRHSLDLAAGSIRSAGGDLLIRTPGQAYTAAEFADLPLRTTADGARLTVGDVAKIRDGFDENDSYIRMNEQPAVVVRVNRTGSENALSISKSVKDYIRVNQSKYPAGVKLEFWDDNARSLLLRTKSLVTSLGFALLIVGGILALFLDVRLAFWVCIGIPIAFAGTLILMPVFGATINLMTLFAFILVLGIVVDDAIVTGDNIFRKMEHIRDGTRAAIEGTREIARPVTFGVLTTVAAFLPLLFVPGMMGRWVRQLPVIVIPVLLFSLVETKLILPAHLKHLHNRWKDPAYTGGRMARGKRAFLTGFDHFVKRIYDPSLALALRWRYVTLGLFVALGVVVVSWSNTRLPRSIMPRIPRDQIEMNLLMPVGTPFEITESHILRIAGAAEAMREDPELNDPKMGPVVRNVLVMMGSGGRSSGPGASHLGQVEIEIMEPELRTLEVDVFDLAERWRSTIGEIPGARELSFSATYGRQQAPVDIQLTGPDFDELEKADAEVRDLLRNYPQLFDIRSTFEPGKEEIQLSLKPEAEQLGISLEDLARQTRRAFFGEEVQRIQRGRDDLRVMVRYPRADRERLHTLETMYIRTQDGGEVPFSSVAEATIGRGYTTIRRIDRGRAVAVLADLDKEETDVEDILEDLDRELPPIIGKYHGMRYSFEGEAREARETEVAFKVGIFATLFMIYVLLAIPFRSYLQPLIVMLVIPFGVIGAYLGHFIMGITTFSMMSQYGILALFGVVVNDSLVLVDYVNQRRREGMGLSEAVRSAGMARFRPIVLTSLTTFGGLMPTMFEESRQAQFLVPMAVSLGWGVLFATFITLYLVPANYVILEDFQRGMKRMWRWWLSPFRSGEGAEGGGRGEPAAEG